MVGWHHWFNVHELGQTPGDGEGQGGLACCSPWGRKELYATWWLNNNFLLLPAHVFLGWKPMKGKLGTLGPTSLSSDLCFNSFQNHSFLVASDPSAWKGRRGKRMPLGMAPWSAGPAPQDLAGVSAFEELRNPTTNNPAPRLPSSS